MHVRELLTVLDKCPLIASVQAAPGSPVDDPQTLLKLARASLQEGVQVLRLQGAENIRMIRDATGAQVIGLLKRSYPDSEIYITATRADADEAIEAGAYAVALDGTSRPRPNGESLHHQVAHIHDRGKLVLADIDSVESARHAIAAGADMVSTTLAGYTPVRRSSPGPDLELLRALVNELTVPVLAEGRFNEPWQVESALRIGAAAVVIGGALNDPIKTTRRFMPSSRPDGPVGAVDIGGTWMRYATFSPDWKLLHAERAPVAGSRSDRMEWIRAQIKASTAARMGISMGGSVDPETGEVWESKPIIRDHAGSVFSQATMGISTTALNDGLATAWGHACLPQFAGLRVATLALGTGVGCGVVAEGKILMGSRGEYPRLNDLPAAGGLSYEELLGGAALSSSPSQEQMAAAVVALKQATRTIREMYFPHAIILCGSVGLSEWIAPHVAALGLAPSPFGKDAGLFGAAALVLFPVRQ